MFLPNLSLGAVGVRLSNPDPASIDAGFFLDGATVLQMINVIVNDVQRQVPEGTTVEALLSSLGLQPRFLAVELNRRVVPRSEHRQTQLAADDCVEIVTLVGGG